LQKHVPLVILLKTVGCLTFTSPCIIIQFISTNKMHSFHKFITWRLCVAQHISGASLPIIRSVKLH
jgi:hypothetical protein